MNTHTLPADDDPAQRPAAQVDHLYLALAGGKPGGGARWALDGIDRIEIGRGPTRSARRDGSTLRIDIADPWLSSNHLRFERERAHWVVLDAESRNGILVGGVKQTRAIVDRCDVVEAGRSFLFLRTNEPVGEPALELAARPTDPLATLDPELELGFDGLRRVAAAASVPILIGGATGTGKERVAQSVHAASRRAGAFVPVNCGALPAGIVESELFGHKKGAFSGAVSDAAGLVVASSGGTLFLDEIGDLAAPAQAALLRVLEQHEVRAVGATATVAVDLRVVAATHRDLEQLVEAGTFREDLLARLTGFELVLPALADRLVDLGAMLAAIAPDATFAAASARALFAYGWPRNVRELVHSVERALAIAAGGEILPAHLSEEIATARFVARAPVLPDARRDELLALLEKHRGNVSQVAVELGRVRQQVQRWLKRYGIDPQRFR